MSYQDMFWRPVLERWIKLKEERGLIPPRPDNALFAAPRPAPDILQVTREIARAT